MATSKSKPTAADLAAWMAQEVTGKGELYQADAWDHISRQNPDLAIETERGGLSISREVLDAFKKLTSKTVVWEPQGRYWRIRVAQDAEGRKQS